MKFSNVIKYQIQDAIFTIIVYKKNNLDYLSNTPKNYKHLNHWKVIEKPKKRMQIIIALGDNVLIN